MSIDTRPTRPATEPGAPEHPERVVLAVGGSSPATGATTWAATEAARLGLPLQVVSAVPVQPNPAPLRPPDPASAHSLEAAAAREVERLVEGLRGQVELLDPAVVTGPAIGAVLDHVDEHTRCLVLGHRDVHAATRLLTGSTSIAVAGRSPVPVAVVPDAWVPASRTTNPVVVGVSLRPAEHRTYEGDPDVLRVAFERADRLRVPLVAVHAWDVPALHSWSPTDIAGFRRRVQDALEEVLAPWRAEFPAVEVAAYAEAERPADAVTDAARVAQAVVVGRHTPATRLGGFHLGSTARGVLHHATTPVLVVPAPEPTRPAHHDGPGWAPTF